MSYDRPQPPNNYLLDYLGAEFVEIQMCYRILLMLLIHAWYAAIFHDILINVISDYQAFCRVP